MVYLFVNTLSKKKLFILTFQFIYRNNLKEQIEKISDKESFLAFLNELIFDFRKNPKEWENSTIDLYLEAMLSWVEDYSSCEYNHIDWNHIDYSAIAMILYMGKIYE